MSADWRTTARDGLVVLLTVTTGAVDATSFLSLGHVFSSVVTGTMVLLGIAAGTHDPGLAVNCAVALASYVAGVVVGAPLAVRRAGRWLEGWPVRRAHRATKHHEIWPSWLTVALALEFSVLAAFCAGLGAGRRAAVRRGAAAAAGHRRGGHGHPGRDHPAARRDIDHVPDRHADRGDLRTGHRPAAHGLWRSLGIFAALVIGALLAALIKTYQPVLLPIVVLPPIALVVWLASARFGPRPAAAGQASQDSQPSRS